MSPCATAARRILVVDDDASIREFIEMALTDEGYEVALATNGREALDQLAADSPSLILLDMAMPVMDGRAFAEAYRATPGPHAPIVVVTAAHEAAERAAQVRADDYIAKPFDLDRLLEIVERHASQAAL
ncbi:MAG TPA: response regulator [Chloroflexota bacterium]